MASFRSAYQAQKYWPFDEPVGVNQSIVEANTSVSSNNDLTSGLVNTGYSLITNGVNNAVQYKTPHLNILFPNTSTTDGAFVLCWRPAEDTDNFNLQAFGSGEGGGSPGQRPLVTMDDLNAPIGGLRSFFKDNAAAGFVQHSPGFVHDQIQPICLIWSWDASAKDFRVVLRNFDNTLDYSETQTARTENGPLAPGLSLGANDGLSNFYAMEYFEMGSLTGTYQSIADMQDTADEVLNQAALDVGLIALPDDNGTSRGNSMRVPRWDRGNSRY